MCVCVCMNMFMYTHTHTHTHTHMHIDGGLHALPIRKRAAFRGLDLLPAWRKGVRGQHHFGVHAGAVPHHRDVDGLRACVCVHGGN